MLSNDEQFWIGRRHLFSRRLKHDGRAFFVVSTLWCRIAQFAAYHPKYSLNVTAKFAGSSLVYRWSVGRISENSVDNCIK